MLTNEQVQFLEGLLNITEVKGKSHLRKVIWLNTVKPKFKEGDVIKFSELNSYTYGNRNIDMIGTVEKVFKWYDGSIDGEKKICYGIRFDIEVDGNIETGLYANTNENLCSKYEGTDTINHIIKKEKYQQSTNI